MIEILMATYNAQEYLLPQLRSIFTQTCQDFRLTIRDNCSTDNTVQMIHEFASLHPGRITLIEGTENLGAKGNFAYLAGISTGEYVMFSDADDVWLPEKIAKTWAEMKKLETLHGNGIPLLVHTDLKVVDKNLNLIDGSFWNFSRLLPERGNELNRIIVQNSVTGCTMMVNRSLLKRACPIPSEAIMHDWWLAVVASALGRIGIVAEPTILYRQHGRNQLGAKRNHGAQMIAREVGRGVKAVGSRFYHNVCRRFGSKIYNGAMRSFGFTALTRRTVPNCPQMRWYDATYAQTRRFLERYRELLSEEHRGIAEAFVSLRENSWVGRRKIVCKHKFYRSTVVHNIAILLLG